MGPLCTPSCSRSAPTPTSSWSGRLADDLAQRTPYFSRVVSQVHSNLNIGNLKACIEFEEYFSYTFSNGESYNLTSVDNFEVGVYYIVAGPDSISLNISETVIEFLEYELGNQDIIYRISF